MKNTLFIKKLKIDQTVANDMVITVYEFVSTKPGKTVYLQSSVHGAELQGNAVIYELFNYLKEADFCGKIILVPLANPYASSQKSGTYTHGRFNPVTGDNWNRMYLDLCSLDQEQGGIDFKKFIESHGEKSAQEINKDFKKVIRRGFETYLKYHRDYGIDENKSLFIELQRLASEADIVLDLHTGARATRYIYSPECQEDKMKDINFPHYIVIPNEFGGAMDEASFMPWFKLSENFKKENIDYQYDFESYTVELGNEEVIDMDAAKNDAVNILNLLHQRDVLKDRPKVKKIKQYKCSLKDYKSYYAKAAGLCEYHIKPGEHFKENDLLCSIYKMDRLDERNAVTEIRALTSGIVIHQTPSASVKKGMELIQVFSNPVTL